MNKRKISTYKNPLIPSYNIGDPFVMRYDGKYYLYPSSVANTPYYCYVSEDLVNWSERIACVPKSEIPSGVSEHGNYCDPLSAYAPEVTYFNGKFIMVTSLGGTGHQFFVADSPIGPFKKVGDKWGCKIDGHIFVDNDGKWYFYSAHNAGGLHGFKMLSPTEVDIPSEQQIGCVIDEGAGTWTEGPMVVYHDGTYFMSYTGNHVCHTAYRIAYGTSKDDPLSFTQATPNPLLVSTTEVTSGIGHSSSVKAPDLDSYYIVYHTRLRQRHLNIDRLVFNGNKMFALGPTVSDTPVPPMPDIYAQFDRLDEADGFSGDFSIECGKLIMKTEGRVLAKEKLARSRYTIELTVSRIDKDALAGVIFGYEDENNFGEALFDTNTEELLVRFTAGGKVTEYRKALVRSFDTPYDFSVLQAIQIEKTGNIFTFYVNDRILCKYESSLDGKGVGMTAQGGGASFGYLGASAESRGTSSKNFPKPVATQTGYLQANLCKEYDTKTGVIAESEEEYVSVSEGETYNYAVFAEKYGNYGFSVNYRSKNGAVISVYANEKYIKDIDLPPSKDFTSVTARDIPLCDGEQNITVYIKNGSADILFYICMHNLPVEHEYDLSAPSYCDGIYWNIENDSISVSNHGKRLYGSYMLGDYTLSVDITPESDRDFGLLVRTQNPGVPLFTHKQYEDEDKQNAARRGATWFQGYYLEFSSSKVTLCKYSFTRTELISADISLDTEQTYHAEVICEGSDISLVIDGNTILRYTDSDPFISGMAGIKSGENGKALFKNFKIVR